MEKLEESQELKYEFLITLNFKIKKSYNTTHQNS